MQGGQKYIVSVPYKITLLSNPVLRDPTFSVVSVPYKITLLSNLKPQINCATTMHRVIT